MLLAQPEGYIQQLIIISQMSKPLWNHISFEFSEIESGSPAVTVHCDASNFNRYQTQGFQGRYQDSSEFASLRESLRKLGASHITTNEEFESPYSAGPQTILRKTKSNFSFQINRRTHTMVSLALDEAMYNWSVARVQKINGERDLREAVKKEKEGERKKNDDDDGAVIPWASPRIIKPNPAYRYLCTRTCMMAGVFGDELFLRINDDFMGHLALDSAHNAPWFVKHDTKIGKKLPVVLSLNSVQPFQPFTEPCYHDGNSANQYWRNYYTSMLRLNGVTFRIDEDMQRIIPTESGVDILYANKMIPYNMRKVITRGYEEIYRNCAEELEEAERNRHGARILERREGAFVGAR